MVRVVNRLRCNAPVGRGAPGRVAHHVTAHSKARSTPVLNRWSVGPISRCIIVVRAAEGGK